MTATSPGIQLPQTGELNRSTTERPAMGRSPAAHSHPPKKASLCHDYGAERGPVPSWPVESARSRLPSVDGHFHARLEIA